MAGEQPRVKTRGNELTGGGGWLPVCPSSPCVEGAACSVDPLLLVSVSVQHWATSAAFLSPNLMLSS